jgi:hypothetical protein
VSARAAVLAMSKAQKPLIEFAKLVDIDDLPQWLGVSAVRLKQFLASPTLFYSTKRLPKNAGGVRVVYKAASDLAAVQRHIRRSVAAISTFRACVQGFVKDRSIATNAQQHLAKKEVLCLDLEDFFGCVGEATVEGVFLTLGAQPEAAAALARLCTRQGILPQGASSSPILANLAVAPLDSDLLTLALSTSSTYTRYADDLTFSGQNVPAFAQVEGIANRHGFALNPAKTKRQPRGRRQWVTGLTVCDSVAPRVSRRLKKQLRLVLHYAETYGLASHLERSRPNEENRIEGLIWFVKGVEPDLGQRLRRQFMAAKTMDEAETDQEDHG